MNTVELLRHEAARAYAWFELNTDDISQVVAVWKPPGSANSIAATFAHTVIAADVDLNVHFHGRPSVLATGGWESRTGLSESFPDDWNGVEDVEWEALKDYGREVRGCIQDLFDSVRDVELERSFEMKALVTKHPGKPPELVSLGTWKGIDLYSLHGGGHIWMHGGEIACLKGLQGAGGYRNFRFLAP